MLPDIFYKAKLGICIWQQTVPNPITPTDALTFGKVFPQLHDGAEVAVDCGVGVRDGCFWLGEPLGDDTPHIRGRDLREGTLRPEKIPEFHKRRHAGLIEVHKQQPTMGMPQNLLLERSLQL